MRHVSYSAFREHLAQYMDEVCDSCAALHVTRQNARTVVLLSEDEYEGMLETLHLLRSPANAKRLLHSIRKANAGKLIERDDLQGPPLANLPDQQAIARYDISRAHRSGRTAPNRRVRRLPSQLR